MSSDRFSEQRAQDQDERFKAQINKDALMMKLCTTMQTTLLLEHGLPPTAGQGIGIDRLGDAVY